jgi:hypothetical protein
VPQSAITTKPCNGTSSRPIPNSPPNLPPKPPKRRAPWMTRSARLTRHIGIVKVSPRRFDALIAAAVGRSKPGLLPASQVQAVANDGAAVLLAGGERPPIPTRDPRQPTAGQAIAEVM